jgi:hypothetical protein
MSLGKRRNHDYWGLVKQIGPFKQTSQDLKNTSSALGTGTTTMGKGGTLHSGHGSYEAEIRPYQVKASLPSVKMSKYAQRAVVTKPMDVNMRKPVPGKKFGSLPSLLKGIAQTLNGIAGRGVAQGVSSYTQAEVATNALNQQTDMPELMVETPSTISQAFPDVVEIPTRIFEETSAQTDEVGRSEFGVQTDQRPAGIFNGSQTDISSEDMDRAVRRYAEARAELASRVAERDALATRLAESQRNLTGSVEERARLEERYQQALQMINSQIPALTEYRDLAEAEIARLQDEVNRPGYTPQTSSTGVQVTAPPSYGPQLSTTGVQAGRTPRDRTPSPAMPRQRRRTITDAIETATRETNFGGSFVNAPGQMRKNEGSANRGKKANRNSINTQTPGAIGVNPSVATRSTTR